MAALWFCRVACFARRTTQATIPGRLALLGGRAGWSVTSSADEDVLWLPILVLGLECSSARPAKCLIAQTNSASLGLAPTAARDGDLPGLCFEVNYHRFVSPARGTIKLSNIKIRDADGTIAGNLLLGGKPSVAGKKTYCCLRFAPLTSANLRAFEANRDAVNLFLLILDFAGLKIETRGHVMTSDVHAGSEPSFAEYVD